MMFSWNTGTKWLLYDIRNVSYNSWGRDAMPWDTAILSHYRNDLSLPVNVTWLTLTCLPPKNRRWRRSRNAALWDPWRTRLRRCWACPGRWGGQLLSPIPGKKEKQMREKNSGDEDQRSERDWGNRQRHLLPKSGMKETSRWGKCLGIKQVWF